MGERDTRRGKKGRRRGGVKVMGRAQGGGAGQIW